MPGRVVAGVRPEHLRPIEGSRPGVGVVTGKIEVVEPLGSQVMIQIMSGELPITAQFERRGDLVVGNSVTLAQRPDTVHAFDVQSGRSVLAAA